MVKVAGGSYNLLLENVAMIASRDDIARDLRGAFHWKVSKTRLLCQQSHFVFWNAILLF